MTKNDGMVPEDFDALLDGSSLGAPAVKAASEEIPESVRARLADAVRSQRSPQRASFDTALNVLLIRENLAGAEWAIQQLRDAAASARRAAEVSPEQGFQNIERALRLAAEDLERQLDKRAAELATREG